MAHAIEAAGGDFVDGSIIGSPPGRGRKPVSLWLSGPRAEKVRALVACDGIGTHQAGPQVGQASAVKMCYAAITKGLTALATEAFTVAAHRGLEEHLQRSLELHQPQLLMLLDDLITSSPPKAQRWIAEMTEIAATCAQSGLPPNGFAGTAELYTLVAATGLGAELPETRPPRALLAVARQLAAEIIDTSQFPGA
jgi:3-hydroxyisobutyrate dehydrogenase-like beta-hydroxyacid dehydrogenase